METNVNSKTLITDKRARSITSAFIPVISDARENYDVVLKQDRETLAQFGATPDSMLAAGLSPESVRYVKVHQKLKVLTASAKSIKDRAVVEDLYLEDEIENTYKQIQHNHNTWNLSVDGNVFFQEICAGVVEGLDSVLTLLQKELASNR